LFEAALVAWLLYIEGGRSLRATAASSTWLYIREGRSELRDLAAINIAQESAFI
jgi:hypothetical protein